MQPNSSGTVIRHGRDVLLGPHQLPGRFVIPEPLRGLVLFAHGSGSSRFSERNQYVARVLQEAGIGTLLFDLLTETEAQDRRLVFDIPFLAERLQQAATAVADYPQLADVPLGYFGASTGAAAALVAAARDPERLRAVVSRGGRPDLAGQFLPDVEAPTLLIVGGDDEQVIAMNQEAAAQMQCERRLVIVPGATHLFPEPGALEEVARLARDWFTEHLPPRVSSQREDREAGPANRAEPMLAAPAGDCAETDCSGALFRNRQDAGRQLAARLRDLHLHNPLVLAIPRGGVVVGATLARELGAELDVVLSRKLRAPFQPELAIGSIGEDGYVYLTAEADLVPGVTDDYLLQERDHQLAEIRRRRAMYSPSHHPVSIEGRTVIVTDDGIATGSTIVAALEVIRCQHPRSVIVAVPVAPPSRIEPMHQLCDQVICLHASESFSGIGQFYDDFKQVEDQEVLELLKRGSEHERRPHTFDSRRALRHNEVRS